MRRKRKKHNMDRKGRESSRLQTEVTRRLEDFEKIGLLSAKMTDHYKMAIHKARSNPIKFKSYLEQVKKDLDRIQSDNKPKEETATITSPRDREVPSPTASTFSSGTSASVSAFTEIASAATSTASSAVLNNNNNNKHNTAASIVSRHEHRKSTGSIVGGRNDEAAAAVSEQSRPSRRSELALAFERKHLRPVSNNNTTDLKSSEESRNDEPEKVNTVPSKKMVPSRSPMVVDVDENATQLEDEQLQELFVEMCFFARLGYVQPPCCLRCTYREALKDGNAKSLCSRWVLWRKDTNQLLHPTQLEGNLLMVQCQAARRLLAGKTIDGFSWYADRQEVFNSNNS